MIQTIEVCRICGNRHLEPVLDLGDISLTSVFPGPDDPDPPKAPLDLVVCSEGMGGCGLVQLRHTVDQAAMYHDNAYGYRSGLNRTMRAHLNALASEISEQIDLAPGDWVVDIGGNDGTLLKNFVKPGLQRLSVDPTSAQFEAHLPPGVQYVPRYFSADAVAPVVGPHGARVITSVAMLYDLPDPVGFAKDVKSCLRKDGLWITEQSYLPAMLEKTAYDAVCHEHLEYYGLRQILHIAKATGLRVVTFSQNDMNGGSIRVVLCHEEAAWKSDVRRIEHACEHEEGRTDRAALMGFAQRAAVRASQLHRWAVNARENGETIWLYGASTKGNVTLEYSGVDRDLVQGAAERNPRKYGRRTPGTGIPIVSEEEARRMRPAWFLVLPWTFLPEFIEREADYLASGGRLVVPLPELKAYGAGGEMYDLV